MEKFKHFFIVVQLAGVEKNGREHRASITRVKYLFTQCFLVGFHRSRINYLRVYLLVKIALPSPLYPDSAQRLQKMMNIHERYNSTGK